MPIVISAPFQQGSYDRLLATCGGSAIRVFVDIGLEITKRYFAQQSIIPPGDAYIRSLWEGLWADALVEGMPRPLAANEIGEPRTLDDSYLFAIADKTLARLPKHRTDDTLRTLCVQILVTLLSPEFKACRQSFMPGDAGTPCLRHSVEHCIDRVSGSHCEDCPFFVALSQDQHRKLLGNAFGSSGQSTLASQVSLFLPEDFRSLRIFWHLHIRQPRS